MRRYFLIFYRYEIAGTKGMGYKTIECLGFPSIGNLVADIEETYSLEDVNIYTYNFYITGITELTEEDYNSL